uniref:Uncharacterized protein n=1 Tax=Rhizophora mucronata TaxID=61149 RepID=A0A2P2MCI1_RHIMU
MQCQKKGREANKRELFICKQHDPDAAVLGNVITLEKRISL